MTTSDPGPVAASDTDDLATMLLAGMPAGHRDALARCAIVAFFDAALYAAALAPGPEPSIDDLLKFGLLERLPGAGDTYRVLPLLQQAAWDTWFAPDPPRAPAPAGLRAVAEAVAAYTDRDVERLRALLLVDADRARAWFAEAFDGADARLDVAGCRNLLDVVAQPARAAFVDEALLAVAEDRRRLLAARATFRAAADASAPGRYLPRAELQAPLERLLGAEGPRVLRVHGGLGRGTSTLVRWFLARCCVPRRVPCALVDLDAVEPVNAARYPWLLLLEIAGQLDGQLPGTPFGPLLRQYGSYRAVLSRQDSDAARSGATALGGPTGELDGRDVEATFIDALNDAAATHPCPVVIALDTFEQVVARLPSDVGTLGTLLRALLDGAPSVRLLVADRLAAGDPGVAALLPPGAVELAVPAFSAVQGAEYLRTTRGITRPEIIAAVLERADGLPWKLAVWGDLVAASPDLTPAELAEVEPEVAWAVDRIVERIDDPAVRWLVRYGALPRRLSRAFAEQVVMGRFRDGVARTAAAGEPLDVAFDDVWQGLLRFAATTSWMWLAPGDEHTVVFHPELREPMRTLVDERVEPLLHGFAVRHYRDLADREPQAWAAWTVEALYHQFLMHGVVAGPMWRGAVQEARAHHVAESVLVVAEEILRSDYLDADGAPLELSSGTPIVEPRLLAAAHAESAWALARIALRLRLPGGDATWSRIEASLDTAATLPVDRLSAPRRRLAQAALAVAREQHATAVGDLAVALVADPEESVDRCIALVLLADALRGQGGNDTSLEALQQARLVADRLGVPEVAGRIAVSLAERMAELGRLDEAERGLRGSIAAQPGLAQDPDVRRALALTALGLGRTAAALTWCREPGLTIVAAEAQLLRDDPGAALDTCTQLLAGHVVGRQRAPVLALRGRALAALLDLERAAADLLGARELFFAAGDLEEASLCTALLADLALHDLGSLREAAHHLDEADGLTLRRSSAARSRCRLLRAQLEVRRGNPATAARAARAVLEAIARATDPRRIVDTALAVLPEAPELAARIVELLTEHLPRIAPDSARLAALRSLDRCPRWAHGEWLVAMVLPHGPVWGDAAPEDAAWLDLRAAELMRVAGRDGEARELVRRAGAPGTAAAAWRRLQAQARIPGVDPEPAASDTPPLMTVPRPDVPAAEAPSSSAADASPLASDGFPLLTAALALARAERALAADDREPARALLAEAEAALRRAPARITRWSARLEELKGVLADRDGQVELAGRCRLYATASRRELGEPSAEAASVELERGTRSVQDALTLQVRLDGPGLRLSGDAGTDELASTHPLVGGLLDAMGSTGRAGLVRAVRDALAAGALLRLDEVLPRLDPAEPADLRVAAPAPLAQLPWELGTVDGRPLSVHPGLRSLVRVPVPDLGERIQVQVLQEALAGAGFDPGPLDGLHGPQTAAAMAGFQRHAGLVGDGVPGPMSWAALRAGVDSAGRAVVVAQHDAGTEPDPEGRGSGDLAEGYATRGWQVRPLAGGDPADGPVDVVHLKAAMAVAGAVVHLDLAGAGGSLLMSVADVDAVVRRLARRGRTPLVVLDVVAPPRFSGETVRQLLQRNDFAQQLLGLGHCYAILATGLAPSWRAAEVQDGLVAALDASMTAPGLARGVCTRASGAAELGDRLPEVATALFTAVAPEQMPHLRRSR